MDDGADDDMPSLDADGDVKVENRKKKNQHADHDYDYTQHLKPIGGGTFYGDNTDDIRNQQAVPLDADWKEGTEGKDGGSGQEQNDALDAQEVHFGITLPVAAMASVDEDEIGMLAKGLNEKSSKFATQDFYDAMDSDYEGEFEELNDDFFDMANEDYDSEDEKDKKQAEQGDNDGNFNGLPAGTSLADLYDQADDDLKDNDADDKQPEERKERIIDSAFERMLDAYDDDEIGELWEEDPEVLGKVDNLEYYEADLTEFADRKKTAMQEMDTKGDEVGKATMNQVNRLVKELELETPEMAYAAIDKQFARPPPTEWDAQSILSTYSNLENHPSLIKAPRKDKKKIALSKKSGIPLGVLNEEEEDEDWDEEDYEEVENLGKKRNKKEDKAAKKARKAAVKAARKANRARKKGLKTMYATESKAHLKLTQQQKIHNPANVVKL